MPIFYSHWTVRCSDVYNFVYFGLWTWFKYCCILRYIQGFNQNKMKGGQPSPGLVYLKHQPLHMDIMFKFEQFNATRTSRDSEVPLLKKEPHSCVQVHYSSEAYSTVWLGSCTLEGGCTKTKGGRNVTLWCFGYSPVHCAYGNMSYVWVIPLEEAEPGSSYIFYGIPLTATIVY